MNTTTIDTDYPPTTCADCTTTVTTVPTTVPGVLPNSGGNNPGGLLIVAVVLLTVGLTGWITASIRNREEATES